MTQVILKYKADGEVLRQYVADPAEVCMIMGPLGSGKTQASCYKLLNKMMRQKPNRDGIRRSRFIAVRNTYSDLSNTTIKDWLELFRPLGEFKQGTSTPPTHHIEFDIQTEENGKVITTTVQSELIFLALDRPGDERKLRGTQLTGAWMNEAKEIPYRIFMQLKGRLGRYPPKSQEGCTWSGIIGDYNAPDEGEWIYKLAEETDEEGYSFHKQPPACFITDELKPNGQHVWEVNQKAENINNLPENYYTNLVKGATDDWIKVNVANQYGFVSDGKPVHPQYNDNIHCLSKHREPRPEFPIMIGYDFGRTPAAALMQLDDKGRIYCFDEFCTDDFSAVAFGREFKLYLDREYPGFTFQGSGDPAGLGRGQATDDTPILMLRHEGLTCQPCETNNVGIRRASLRNPMLRLCMDGRPAFELSPNCKMIRKGLMGGFRYRQLSTSNERYTEEPDKNQYSHPVEALEYGAVALGEGKAAIKPANAMTETYVINTNFDVFG